MVVPLWYFIKPFLLRVWERIKKDEVLMSQELLPGYGNVPTMDRVISHLKQNERKK